MNVSKQLAPSGVPRVSRAGGQSRFGRLQPAA